jgi:hypothetical protein
MGMLWVFELSTKGWTEATAADSAPGLTMIFLIYVHLRAYDAVTELPSLIHTLPQLCAVHVLQITYCSSAADA